MDERHRYLLKDRNAVIRQRNVQKKNTRICSTV